MNKTRENTILKTIDRLFVYDNEKNYTPEVQIPGLYNPSTFYAGPKHDGSGGGNQGNKGRGGCENPKGGKGQSENSRRGYGRRQ